MGCGAFLVQWGSAKFLIVYWDFWKGEGFYDSFQITVFLVPGRHCVTKIIGC